MPVMFAANSGRGADLFLTRNAIGEVWPGWARGQRPFEHAAAEAVANPWTGPEEGSANPRSSWPWIV